jgi:hypothetical protein
MKTDKRPSSTPRARDPSKNLSTKESPKKFLEDKKVEAVYRRLYATVYILT